DRAGLVSHGVGVSMRQHHQVTTLDPHRRLPIDGEPATSGEHEMKLGDTGPIHPESPGRAELGQAEHRAADVQRAKRVRNRVGGIGRCKRVHGRSDKNRVRSTLPRHATRSNDSGTTQTEDMMPKYLITYHGGQGMPTSAEGREQVIAAFMTWVQSTGDAMVDPGAPLGRCKTVSVHDDDAAPPSEPTSGYTIIEAEDLETAVVLVRSHPFITRGGTLQVLESVAP